MAESGYVSVAEVKEMLTEENEKRGELIPSLKAALTAATETCPLSKEGAEDLIEKVTGIISELSLASEDSKAFLAVKIADTLPRSPAEVRSLFTKERVTLSEEIIQAILNAVAEVVN